MVGQTDAGSGSELVLVGYYARTIEQVREIIDDFQASSGLVINRTLVVDNGGALELGRHELSLEVIKGDNSFWEFSGWSAGLDRLGSDFDGNIILLNDSYRRNWTIGWPGRWVIHAMAKDARRGQIAGWLDNFSRVSRCVNSRIVILPRNLAPVLRRSIDAAINDCLERQAKDVVLFDALSSARLERWMAKQDGRWTEASAATRWPRIFVEHHLFDHVPQASLSLRPRTWLGSQLYGVMRKMSGERR